jgi:hypothetical protein
MAKQTMRMAGEAIARQAGIENGDLPAGTAELQGGSETGKAAANNYNIIIFHLSSPFLISNSNQNSVSNAKRHSAPANPRPA